MAKAGEAISKTKYDIHPGVAIVQKWIAELKGKTGRSLEEWIAFAKKDWRRRTASPTGLR